MTKTDSTYMYNIDKNVVFGVLTEIGVIKSRLSCNGRFVLFLRRLRCVSVHYAQTA